MRTLRKVGVLAGWFLGCAFASIVLHNDTSEKVLNHDHNDVTSVSLEDEYFTLCNKKLFLKDMPYAKPHDDAPFGMYGWKRNLDNAVLIDNGEPIYGRTGNQIQEFFHAFDMAHDRGVSLVLHENGFPMDKVLTELFLGISNKTKLEERFGVNFYESIDAKYISGLEVVKTDQLFHYESKDLNLADIMAHRQYIIQELYRITAEEMKLNPESPGAQSMCSSLYAFFGKDKESKLKELLGMKDVTAKYTVIHARSLEILGEKFMARASTVFGVDSRVGKEYPADLISSILSPLGMNSSSILMITDGQNPGVVKHLSSDPVTGPYFQVVPDQVSTVSGDMMLAILSDVFIGNPVSTFSQYIAQVRYALGIGNSYLFAKRNGDNWETFCNDEECFYHWQQIWIQQF